MNFKFCGTQFHQNKFIQSDTIIVKPFIKPGYLVGS
jgi:hypothetical protein